MYDGARLAARRRGGVDRYRLGVPDTWRIRSSTNRAAISGNYGLLDQIEALWVRAISPFGGNASNVSIAGQSSGGLGRVSDGVARCAWSVREGDRTKRVLDLDA
jgi:carboxylesterase type B